MGGQVASEVIADRLCRGPRSWLAPGRAYSERAIRGPCGSTEQATGSTPVWYEAVMGVLMSLAEREEFLAGVHVGVLSAAVGTAGRTLAIPVWYSYQPGGLLTVLTGRRSRKAGAIRAAGRFGLCVQDDSPPYRYVSVEGPVVSEEELDPAERLAMARRYLGSAGGDRYVTDNSDPEHENVAFRMRPEHWLSQDQGKGQAAG
jgi:nitroimidazol reductase NimA-like FMN-containing flavoprotein (pyridoxamine 5'-phosphate oxidase superfamily)